MKGQRELQELTIEPGKAEANYWRDLWHYRELFYILSWRDIKVRYKQTVLGALWSIIRPLLTMIVFTVVFSKIANLGGDSGNTPYAIMVFAGLLPWQFFSTALSESSGSLISNTNLISKVYFPRMIIPTASVITSMIDFLITFGLMLVMMIYYEFMPSWKIVYLPFFLTLSFVASMGIGLWLTALNVKYRDFRYIVPFIVQFGLYISPVGFISSRIPAKYRLLYDLNPMVGVIDGFRWSIIGRDVGFPIQSIVFSVITSLTFLWLGISRFRKTEKLFADLI